MTFVQENVKRNTNITGLIKISFSKHLTDIIFIKTHLALNYFVSLIFRTCIELNEFQKVFKFMFSSLIFFDKTANNKIPYPPILKVPKILFCKDECLS
jgi:hypothetical protein